MYVELHVGWSVCRSVGPSVRRSVGPSVRRSVGWSFGQSIGRRVNRLGGQLVSVLVRNSKAENNAKTPVCWMASKFALNSKPENNTNTCMLDSIHILIKFKTQKQHKNIYYSFQINLIFSTPWGKFPTLSG
jgi:hypothetical protein